MSHNTRSKGSNKLTKTEMTNKDQPLDADDLSSTIPQASLVMEDSENSASENREDVPHWFARYRREISKQIGALQSNSSEQFETLLREIKNMSVKSQCDIAQIQDDVARLTCRVTANEHKLYGGQQPVSSEWGSALAAAARLNDREVIGGARQQICSHVTTSLSPCCGTHLMMVNFRGLPPHLTCTPQTLPNSFPLYMAITHLRLQWYHNTWYSLL